MKTLLTAALTGSLVASSWGAKPSEIAREEELTATGSIVSVGATGRAVITLDRNDATYGCGTNAVFTIRVLAADKKTSAASGTVTWSLDNFGAAIVNGETEYDLAKGNPFTVSGTLTHPGFLRVTVKGRDEKGKTTIFGRFSAAYEPAKLTTARPKPADFDEFWAKGVADLAAAHPNYEDVVLGPPETLKGYTRQRISLATVGGKRVYGALCRPTAKGKFPIIVYCPGAGTGFVLPRCSGRPDRVALYMSAHGFELQATEAATKVKFEEQEKYWRGVDARSVARAYPVGGLTLGPTRSHYYDKILGINRAVDYIVAQDYVDRRTVVYSGASQGGGLGLILVGLNTHFTRAYTGVPAMCDWSSCLVGGRQSGWPRLAEYEPHKTPEDLKRIETMQLNARYIDAAYFASRITIPILLTVGFIDESCAPHTVFSAYNGIPSKAKYLYQGIGGSHGSPMADYRKLDEWLFAK